MRRPKHTIKIHHSNLEFTDEGIFITQGKNRYAASVKEIDDQEYFIVIAPLTGQKVYIEIDYSEKN